MKNFVFRLAQLSLLAVSGILPIANGSLCAHIDQVGPVSKTEIEKIVTFIPNSNALPGAIALDHTNMFVTFPLINEIRKYSQKGKLLHRCELPISPDNQLGGLAVKWNKEVFIVVNAFFSMAPEDNAIWKINKHGHAHKFAQLPADGSPSHLVFDKSDHLYVTDSVRGEIYKIDHEGKVKRWIRHPLLQGNPAGAFISGTPTGASAIAMGKKSKYIYVANTDYGTILRIKIKQDGSAGKITVYKDDILLEGTTALSINRRGILYASVPYLNTILEVTKKDVKIVYSGNQLDFPSGLVMKKHKGINLGYFTNSAFNDRRNPGIFELKVAANPYHAD